MPKHHLSSCCKGFIEENQKAIVLLLFLISIIGAVAGYRYYRYTKDDPAFCMSCHMMQEAFRTWQKSKHWNYPCQRCHEMSVLEQNRMLIDYVLKETKTAKQKHGRISPWKACKDCHLSEVEQGSVTLNNSYGHAQHVFMQQIPCSRCHMGGDLHTFAPNEQACLECHADKAIHGLGMAGFSCLKCHSYSEKAPKMISNDRCLGCHKDLPRKGPMSSLKCFDCHHPHGQMKPTNDDCLKNCHGYETKVGQHNLHMTKAQLHCLDCHKAHTWVIGKKEARTLCDRCHKLKDPATFIN
jgi:hypothetical protein